jgi:hypothetical protein
MKKFLIVLSVGFTSLAAISNCAYAQNSTQPVAFNDSKSFKSAIRNMAALESPAFMGTYVPDVKDINARAIKDFNARFNGANNAMWFSDRNGFTTYFIKDGYGDRVFYDKKGHWQYALIFYSEDKLPRDVRAAVKSTYFDMAITLVEEVQTIEAKVYIVHLEDKTNIKILKVNDEGEFEILQDLSKG